MRHDRRAKILATLGPATNSEQAIHRLVTAGADLFRVNFSHGAQKDKAELIRIIRKIESEIKNPIGILVDLQGPKLRIGKFENGSIRLKIGQVIRFDLDSSLGNAQRVCLPHPEVIRVLSVDKTLLLDDGRVRLRVIKHANDHVMAEVTQGIQLSDNKGFNLPDVSLPVSAMTSKDREDLAFALKLNIDWVALSFVQRAEDVIECKQMVDGRAAVMAKLEKPQAIEHLKEIVNTSDGIMVARGDLGVEMPPEDVPSIQKRIVRECRNAGRPVVVATQMLESMINAPAPTRAESSDVATAIYDGADATMLSAETAVGDFPNEAVSMMAKIIRRTEQDPLVRELLDISKKQRPDATPSDAFSAAARQITETLDVAAIVCFTMSGKTAYRVSRERPAAPIVGLTASMRTARRMTLSWGVRPMAAPDVDNFDDMVEEACITAVLAGFAVAGDRVAITAGVPFGTAGMTNIIHLAVLTDQHQAQAASANLKF